MIYVTDTISLTWSIASVEGSHVILSDKIVFLLNLFVQATLMKYISSSSALFAKVRI